jgi:hypothetical protein
MKKTGQKFLIFIKVNLSLCFKLSTAPWRRIGEWRYSSTHSLISALDGGEWSASRPNLFASRERAPGTHWIGGWVGPRADLDAVKRKIPSLCRDSNPRSSSPLTSAMTLSYPSSCLIFMKLKNSSSCQTSAISVQLSSSWYFSSVSVLSFSLHVCFISGMLL